MDHQYQSFMQNLRYMIWMRPVFKMDALFSDETENYVSPMEPNPGDTVRIRFRTGRDNVDQVYFISGVTKKEMQIESSDSRFDYYTVEIEAGEEPIYYYFEIQAGRARCFYNKLGVSRDLQQSRSFCIVPGFSTPAWMKGAVIYQIFTDRFCNGDPTNDVGDREYIYIGEGTVRARDWNKMPEAHHGIREFYGGDLQGVLDKLDYLQELGVEVLYFNPLFVSPSTHKYDIQDYDYIDPHFGKIVRDEGQALQPWEHENKYASRYITRVTNRENLEASNQLFIRLVEELHKRGMRIILDGVFNHCGSFNKWMDRERIYENQPGYAPGAYVSSDSPYRSFFHFYNEHEWPYNGFYDGWWGHDTLPKLNYEQSHQLEEYILKIAEKWVSPPYNVDGWRLDVAADLGFSPEYNHEFWRKFRRTVKTANPEAVILAEHYGDAGSWLRGDQWDTVMNYDAFMEPLTWFFTGMEKHSDDYQPGMYGNVDSFIGAMTYHMASFLGPSLQIAMNELSNHDHSRFLTRTNHRVGRVEHLGAHAAEQDVRREIMREAVVMQMTWPGAPTLYYGDEAGVCGFTDPDNRRPYPWGREDQEMIAFHRAAIQMHRSYPVLSRGSLRILYGEYNCLAYGRFNDMQQIIVVFNNNEEEREMKLPVWVAGVQKRQMIERVFFTDRDGFSWDNTSPWLNRRLYGAENDFAEMPGGGAQMSGFAEMPGGGERMSGFAEMPGGGARMSSFGYHAAGTAETDGQNGIPCGNAGGYPEVSSWSDRSADMTENRACHWYDANNDGLNGWTSKELNTAEISAWTIQGAPGENSDLAAQEMDENNAWTFQGAEDTKQEMQETGSLNAYGSTEQQERVCYKVRAGKVTLTMPPNSAAVFVACDIDPAVF